MPSYCDERYRDIYFSFSEIVNNIKKKKERIKRERGEKGEKKGKVHEEHMHVSEMKREMTSCCSLRIVGTSQASFKATVQLTFTGRNGCFVSRSICKISPVYLVSHIGGQVYKMNQPAL